MIKAEFIKYLKQKKQEIQESIDESLRTGDCSLSYVEDCGKIEMINEILTVLQKKKGGF